MVCTRKAKLVGMGSAKGPITYGLHFGTMLTKLGLYFYTAPNMIKNRYKLPKPKLKAL